MNRITLGLATAVLALAAGLWWAVSSNGALRTERDTAVQAQKQAAQAAKRTESIQGTARAEKRVQARKSATVTEALSEAVKAAPDWAGTQTPIAVQEALAGAVAGLE